MSDTINHHPRQEVEIPLTEPDTGETTIFPCRPTLSKVAAVESRLGSAASLLSKVVSAQVGITELCSLVAIILQGVKGAPTEAAIRDAVFQRGSYTYVGPCARWLIEATRSSDTAPAPKEGSATPNP